MRVPIPDTCDGGPSHADVSYGRQDGSDAGSGGQGRCHHEGPYRGRQEARCRESLEGAGLLVLRGRKGHEPRSAGGF